MSFAPLAGIRVLDLTTSFAGPYCTQILAGLGADVIKLEPLTGDSARGWGPPFSDGVAAMFLAANVGKRSIAIDLKKGIDVVLRLADRADVLVQSLKPGQAKKLRIGPDDLLARNARLVYCSVNAYGRTGPKSHLPGYDPLMQAAGGLISVTGEQERPPVRLGISAIDQGTGIWAALGVLAALLERETTGRGRQVDTALYETALSFMGYHLIGYFGTGNVPQPSGTAFPSLAPYQIFDAGDGRLMIAAATDQQFASLVEVAGLPELADEPRFATNQDRVANREALTAILADRLRRRSCVEWLERLAAAGVPAAPVQDVAEVAVDEQTTASGMLQPTGTHTVVSPPLSVDEERLTYHAAAPVLGEHTSEILDEAGYSCAEIELLVAEKIARLAPADERHERTDHAHG